MGSSWIAWRSLRPWYARAQHPLSRISRSSTGESLLVASVIASICGAYLVFALLLLPAVDLVCTWRAPVRARILQGRGSAFVGRIPCWFQPRFAALPGHLQGMIRSSLRASSKTLFRPGRRLKCACQVERRKDCTDQTRRTKIALIAWGTRGDVQPVVALAVQLMDAGYKVKMMVSGGLGHDLFVRSCSVDVCTFPCILDFDARALMKGKTPKSMGCVDTGPEHCTIFSEVREFMPDLLLYPSRNAVAAWTIEEQLHICTIQYEFHWSGSCNDNAQILLQDVSSKTKYLDAYLNIATLQGLDMDKVLDRMGRKHPILYAVSEDVADRENDWPSPAETSGVHMMGHWILDQTSKTGLGTPTTNFFGEDKFERIQTFLTGGPPVYIGWGSMNGISTKFMAQLAVRALKALGKRGIIAGAYAKLNRKALGGAEDELELKAYADANVLWLKWAPHEWLMPKCSVVVHHGGCGTTAASLRSGRPTVITPVAFDQFYWAEQVQRKGVGVKTGQLASLREQDLVSALRACESEDVVRRAAALGHRLREESGVSRTVEWLSSYIKTEVVQGHWMAE